MKMWIKLGFRNLWKNRRRSLFTIAAISFGFAAVNLLGGFTHYVFRGLEDSYVYAYGNGHMSIFKQGYLKEGALDPTSYLLDASTLRTIIKRCDEDARIVVATPQLNINGLVSNGNSSSIMIAEGRVPEDAQLIRSHGHGFIGKLKMFRGAELSSGDEGGVGMTTGLGEKLGLGLDSNAIVMAATVDGFMNALDANVVQVLDAPMDILDDMLMAVPLSFAQDLYETQSADRINVLLSDPDDKDRVMAELARDLQQAGLSVEIHPWDELRPSYLRIKNMFDVIFSFVFAIVLIIVFLSIVNTVGMAVLERTREIGTLRSLGCKRHDVIAMFATEAGLLALFGSILGAMVTFACWAYVTWSQPTWTPPNIPKEVPLEIHLVPWLFVASLCCLMILASTAALVPARRAARMNIIDALGHT
ncbi:MAG: ABC transporter permease [Desulfuromonas sp.]|nr:MAG: ABC transporter permease [Desulfuromonas sp.]